MGEPSDGGEPLTGFDPKATYDSAAVDYATAGAEFWAFLSTRTVELVALHPGERVLDVPCGTGLALPAAAAGVGPTGQVVGVDYAPAMLAIARTTVAELTPPATPVELQVGDMTDLDFGPETFDAVVCVLGIFFVDDMPAVLRSFGNLLRPGGRLGVGVFGDEFYQPMIDVFVDAVAAVDPEVEVVQPWRRTAEPARFRDMFADAGFERVEIETETRQMPLDTPDDWWRIVIGSGLRHTVASLGPEAAAEVRSRCNEHVLARHVDHVVVSAQYAVARP